MLQTRRRPTRRPGRLLSAIASAVAVLATTGACGFDYATDQVYIASEGVDYRSGDLDVLNAAVVSAQEGSGTFVATFTNNSQDAAEQVVGITAGEGEPAVQVSGFTAVEVGPTGLVNLSESPSAVVTGDFIPGDYVPITIDLREGEDIDLNVPVVAATDFWEGLDVSGGAGEGSTGGTGDTESPNESSTEPSTESDAESH